MSGRPRVVGRLGHTRLWSRLTSIVIVSLAGVLALAACSSSSSQSQSNSGASSSAAAGGSTSQGALPFLERPSSVGVTAPLNGPVPKGKTIVWINCDYSPACVSFDAPGFAAAKLLGWHFVSIPGGETPQSLAQAWTRAISLHPD